MRLGLRLGLLMLAVVGGAVSAQTSAVPGATKSDAEVQKENAQAETLYQQQNFLGALPLFDDLHLQRPESNVFRERLAVCLLARAGTEAPSEAAQTRERAKKLLLEAKAGGDNSGLLEVLLEKLSAPSGAVIQKSPGAELMLKGEKEFSNGNLKKALALYKQAAEADPKLCEAALFAGDTEFKMKDYDEAGKWYAKAIAINPDRNCLSLLGRCVDAEGRTEDGTEQIRRCGDRRAVHQGFVGGTAAMGERVPGAAGEPSDYAAEAGCSG
ncbi:MAG TPA: tetratricopeptide repeat protein [Edaphobacter sp.]|nr:tetratricopeptide repeat protein [Edaphobacter sp.]